ncbi:MAG TPA: hypothetical protein VHX61_12615 [Rhizomicrobium sp.]|nr:hypothetical protein [Rhizomicrobium sp.]
MNENPQQIISMSFGFCEASLGLGGNQILYDTYQQAAAEGFSVFVAAGDGGAAGCDYTDGNTYATDGISISGYASTPFTVAVGGTTFGDWLLGDPGYYWKSSNGKYYESAKSYIPEIPWNSSCGNYLLAVYYAFTRTYGSSGFCSSEFQTGALLRFMAGSGGPSACALAAPQGSGCAGYGKPGWQNGILGNPGDQVRDVPDVSIIAGGAEWGQQLRPRLCVAAWLGFHDRDRHARCDKPRQRVAGPMIFSRDAIISLQRLASSLAESG